MQLPQGYQGIIRQVEAYRPWDRREAADRENLLRYLRQFDDLLGRENPLAHLTASSWIVDPSRTQVLMVYHNIYDSWSWTGGHADGDADLLAVAMREAQEETGVPVRPVRPALYGLEILPVPAHEKRGKQLSAHLHLNLTYLLEADPSVPLRKKPDENRAVAWFEKEAAVRASSEPEMRPVYARLNAKLSREMDPEDEFFRG